MRNKTTLLVGAVAYDPKVVTIWEGFRKYFVERNLDFDFILYSNYECQVEAHLAGHVDIAWNSPLAWLQVCAAAAKLGRTAEAICMRDTDRDLTSVVLVRENSGIRKLGDLNGKRVGAGAQDSPQAYFIPLNELAKVGLLPSEQIEVVPFDVLVGKHGDHIGGERKAVQALLDQNVDAACVIDSNYLAFSQQGIIPTGAVRSIARTPPYDHCNFTGLNGAPTELVACFRKLLLDMSYSDPNIRPLLDLEGLKQWLPGRTEGYRPLSEAVDRFNALQPFLRSLNI